MEMIGFSMAMGTFIAGVLLADSEYRHELEISIEPFKGLLLGLFYLRRHVPRYRYIVALFTASVTGRCHFSLD